MKTFSRLLILLQDRHLFELIMSTFLMLSASSLLAQGSVWGVTASGGKNNAGIIFEYNLADNTYVVRHEFNGTSEGWGPTGSLCRASNGKLYGVTRERGLNNLGVIFEFDPSDMTFTKKIDFDGTNGKESRGSLTAAPNGKLYGMTRDGGVGGVGVLFEYDPATNVQTVKINFNSTSGYAPISTLTLGNNGKLYGTAWIGGVNSRGVIFEFDPDTGDYKKLHEYNGGVDGSFPWAGVTIGSDAILYGTMPDGGAYSNGYIYSYNLTTNVYFDEYDFKGTDDGVAPYGGKLTRLSNGSLFGLSSSGQNPSAGPDQIFKFDPQEKIFSKVYTFKSNETSSGGIIDMYNGLIQVNDTTLYGLTHYGGEYSYYGTFFKFNLVKSKYEILRYFANYDGAYPENCSLLFIPSQEVVTSVEENVFSNIVYVTPNPASDLFVTTSKSIPITKISLRDAMGRMIEQHELSFPELSYTLSLKRHNKGIYFVTIELEQGKVATRRIVLE